METSIERSICDNKRCFSCGGLVYAVEKKMTTNHIYHNRCFRCRICKRSLTGLTLNEEGDDIYCDNCYRKKTRGDCNRIEFQRAAEEKAQYVYCDHHPDQPTLSNDNYRRPSRPDFLRHPSWTLRQLERQYLSQQNPPTFSPAPEVVSKEKKTLERSKTLPAPLKIRTSFSTPINLTRFNFSTKSLNKSEPSPPLEFFPVFSPHPLLAKESNRTTTSDSPSPPSISKALNDLQSRLNRKSTNSFEKNPITPASTPSNSRKSSVTFNLTDKGRQFSVPNLNLTPSFHRRINSVSAIGRSSNRSISLRRYK